MNDNNNVVNLWPHLAARGQAQPYAGGAAVPNEQYRQVPEHLMPPAYAQQSGYPPHAQYHPYNNAPVYAQAERLAQMDETATPLDATLETAPGPVPGTALVPARRRLPVLRRRPLMVDGRLDGAELVRREERRAARRRRAQGAGDWLLARGWWVIRGLGVTVRGVWRVVWQPDMTRLIKAMEDPDKARRAKKELRKDRRRCLLGLVLFGGAAYGAARIWGDDLLESLPWWSYAAAVLVLVPSLALLGRPEPTEEEAEAVEEMPASLGLDASDRGVASTLAEAFKDIKIRAKVNQVQRETGGWGWTVALSALDGITEPKLEALERYLNTPVGGLVLSPETKAARVRYLRIVMADLLANPIDAPQRARVSVRTPVELATRFDGGRLALELFARHVLIIGRTGSGKSGVLLDVVDALIHMKNVTVDGLDLTGGPDLRSFTSENPDESSLRKYVGGPDYVAAEALLADNKALIQDRTARLGARNWDPDADGPGHVLVIDEYGMVAESPQLREHVEYIATYGAKAGVTVVLGNQRKVKEMMGSSLIASQVHIKIYLGMSAEDAAALPKAVRELGVRPHLFQQASGSDANDAGKAFVLGVEPTPILVRFDRMDRVEAQRHAIEQAPYRPQLGQRDQDVIRRAESDGVPELLLLVRDAIVATAGAAHRAPERASGEEISAYLGKHGRAVDKTALVRELRKASGGLITKSRDTNLAPGSNPKGFYLEDLDQAITKMRERAQEAADRT